MSDFIEEDSSVKNLYGDIFILKYQSGRPVDITISDYSVFYSDRFDNFSNYSSNNDDDINYDDIIITEKAVEDTDEIINGELTTNDLDYDNYKY